MSEDWLSATREPPKLPAVIEGYELAAVLTHLMKKKSSGRLTLKTGEVERTIQLMQGVISSVASKDEREKMVSRFRYRRKLDKQQHAAVQALMQKENLRFGAALLKLKIVDTETFAGMLGEHHAFLLGRCLKAKAVHVSLDTAAKGPADRAPLKFLEAVERSVRAMPFWRRWSLGARLRPLVMTVAPEDLPLFNRLDPTPPAKRIVEATSGNGVRSPSLVAQAGGRKAVASFEALALCGLLKPTDASLRLRRSRVPAFAAVAAMAFILGAFATYELLKSTSPAGVPEAAAAVATPAAPTPAPVDAAKPEKPAVPPIPEKCLPALDAGEAALKNSKTSRAFDELSKAKRCAPNAAVVHRALGVAWLQKGKPKKAADEFKRYLELAPFADDQAVIRQLMGTDLQ